MLLIFSALGKQVIDTIVLSGEFLCMSIILLLTCSQIAPRLRYSKRSPIASILAITSIFLKHSNKV